MAVLSMQDNLSGTGARVMSLQTEVETNAPTQQVAPNNELLCDDCKKTFEVPFDNGDGKVRCAGCATDYYMRQPFAGVTVFKHPSAVDLNTSA
jgi:hypothetical protein